MNKSKVIGKIKNLSFYTDTGDLEVTILVTDAKFRKKLLRDLSLSGNLKINGTDLVFVDKEEEDA